MMKLPPIVLQKAETAAGALVLRRRRRRRSADGHLLATDAELEKPEWARVLAATLDAERQRGEIRAWICKDGVDEHADARHVRRLLGELSEEDLSRPFGDERTFGDLALERGRLHFLGAYLDAGGVAPLKEGGPSLALGPKGRLASPRSVNRCRMLADDWRRYEAAARRSLRPGSHPADLATYLAKGIVGVRSAAVARRRRLLAYIEWLRRRAAGGTLLFKGPAVDGVALKPAEPVEGHERARLLLGDAAQESPDSPRVATSPRSRVMQMLRRQRRRAPPVPPAVADALAKRGLGRLVTSTTHALAPPVPEVKKPPEDDNDLECSICLSFLTSPVHTPCLHVFCRACVQKALSRNKRCPICRALVPEGSTRPCGGALVERLDALRGDAAAQKPLNPRFCVRGLGAKCASTLGGLRQLAEDRRRDGAPLAGGCLSGVFEVQRLALAVAILCHPGCDVRVRGRVEEFL
jgi:hypothetical protein